MLFVMYGSMISRVRANVESSEMGTLMTHLLNKEAYVVVFVWLWNRYDVSRLPYV